jgi:hypothetical protein
LSNRGKVSTVEGKDMPDCKPAPANEGVAGEIV